MTLRVLYAISSLHHGGAERQLVELIRGLDRSRYEPRLALCDTTDQFGYAMEVGGVIDLRSAAGSTLLTFARLVAALRAERPAVLHTFGGLLNIYGRLAVRATGIGAAVSAVRNGRPPARDLAHEALTWPLADAIVANSVGIRDVLAQRAHIPAARIDVVENGVDTGRFHPMEAGARDAARARWGLAGRALVLPARMSPEKNHLGVIRALGILRGRDALPGDVTVCFAGRVYSPDHDERLKRAVEAAGVTDRVHFEGPVDEMPSLLAAADAVLLPSTYEGMPNVVLEGLACGTPALVSPAANRDGVVRDGTEGIQVHGTEPGALAEALARWLGLPEVARRAMGTRARARAEEYTLGRMVERTCAIYDRVLASRRLPGVTAGC